MKQFTQNRFLVLLVALLLLANLVLLSYFFIFKKPEHGKLPQNRPIVDYVQKELGLTPEQSAKFQQLRDQHKKNIGPLMQDMQKLKDSMYSLLRSPSVNDSAVTAYAKKIGAKQQEWEMMIFHHFQNVRAICDSSQLPKFDSLVHRMLTKGPWHRGSDKGDKKPPPPPRDN